MDRAYRREEDFLIEEITPDGYVLGKFSSGKRYVKGTYFFNFDIKVGDKIKCIVFYRDNTFSEIQSVFLAHPYS